MNAAIYLIASVGKIKIGYSKNPWKRYRQLCTGAASPMALIATVYCYDAPAAEKFLHNHFKEHRAKGEWFNIRASEALVVIGRNNLIGGKSKPCYTKPETAASIEGNRQVTPEESAAFFKDMKAMFKD